MSKNKEVTIPELQKDGQVVMVTKKATVLSFGVGEYTSVNSIINNILDFSGFTGEKIGIVITQMTK